MQNKLIDLVDIYSGLSPNRGLTPNCHMIPIRAIGAYGIDYKAVESVSVGKKSRNMLTVGDVLLVNRGAFSVGLIGADFTDYPFTYDKVGVPSFVFVLRVADKSHLLPEYLHWWLNTDGMQNRMRALQQGGAIPFLSRSDLGDFTIPMPDMDTQQKIAHIYKNQLAYTQKAKQRLKLQNTYINTVLNQAVHT